MLKRSVLLMALMLMPITALIADTSQHDYAYAMALARRRGWYDMAEVEFKKLMEHSDDKVKISGQFGLAKILIFQADRETNPAKKTKLLDAALTKIEDLVTRYGDELIAGRFDLGELQKQKANFLLLRAEKETDKAAELKGAARTSFEKAVEAFRVVAEKLKGAKDEDNKFIYRKARYFIIETQFEQALTWPIGHKNRNAVLSLLKAEIEAFGWDHEGYIASYFAYVILGQVHASLITKKHPRKRDMEDTFAAYDFVLSAEVDPLTQRVRTTCYWRYIQTCNRFKFFDKALEIGKKLKKEYPQAEDLNFGKAATLELAKTHFGKRDYGRAMAIAQRIAQKGGYWGNKAKLLIASWKSVIGASNPKTSFLIGGGYLRSRSWWEAIRNFQEVLAGIDRLPALIGQATGKKQQRLQKELEEAKETLPLQVWERMAVCYRRLGLMYESYHCLMQASLLAKEKDKQTKAAEHGFFAFRTIKRAYYRSRAACDLALVKKAETYFTSNFQNSVYYPGIRVSQARDLEEDKKYSQAAEAFAQISKGTEFYEEAISRIGICWYKVAKARLAKSKSVDGPVEEAANKAISGFDQYMAYIDKHKASGKEAKEKRDELLAKVVYFRASLSDKLGKGQEVMDTLKGFEKKYAKTGSASLIGAAIWLRLKTLVNRAEEAGEQKNEAKQQKLLDDANNELRLLSKAARGSRHVQFGHMRIGFTYDKMSKKYKKGDPQRDALTEKAAGHLYVWARNYGPISYKLLKYVAVKIFLLAGEDNSKYLNQAAVLFGRLLKDFPKQAKKDQIAAHVAKCYLLTGRFAQSISVLRQEYAVNPRSGFAIRGLGRAYFEVASKPSGSRSAYRSLILNAAEEDLALTRHTKNKDMMRYMVQRGSVLYEAKERLRKKKPMWNMSNEKYDAFQRSELAKPVKARVKFFRKLVDNYYTRLQNRLKGMRAGAEIKSAAGVFGFDRCRYYFRTAARKTVKLSPKWWDAKYYIIKSFVREGQLRQDYADRIDGPEKKLNKRLANQQKKLAKRLWNNLSTLYSDFSNPENKKRFSDLREDIQNALQGG